MLTFAQRYRDGRMKIDGTNRVTSLRKKKPTGINATEDFTDSLSSSSLKHSDSTSSTSSASSPAADVSSLMQLQDISIFAQSREQVIKSAYNLLDELERIQSGMISGTFDRHSLASIEALLQDIPEGQHPVHIEEILKFIKQRAAVELAKLEMSKLT